GSITWLGNDFRDLDQPMRAALAVPVLWMLCRMPYDLRWLWGGIVIGVSFSMGVGWWQLHILGMERAEGYLNIIHFGNIALVYGAFSAGGLQWSSTLRKHRHIWRSEEHTSELQSRENLVCRLLLEKKKK